MSEKKQNNPKTIAALGVGTVAAVGFAVWNVSNALAPPPGVPATPTAPTPAAPAPTTTAPTTTAAAPDAAQKPVDQVAAAPSEVFLAPSADPFMPPPTRFAPPTEVAQYSAPVPAGAPQVSTGPVGGARLPGLTPPIQSNPFSQAQFRPIPPIQPANAAPSLQQPELVGTLMGEQPCAVFRGDKQLVTVPVGGSFWGWKVMGVRQGEVSVKGLGRTMRLAVGVSSAPMVAKSAPRPIRPPQSSELPHEDSSVFAASETPARPNPIVITRADESESPADELPVPQTQSRAAEAFRNPFEDRGESAGVRTAEFAPPPAQAERSATGTSASSGQRPFLVRAGSGGVQPAPSAEPAEFGPPPGIGISASSGEESDQTVSGDTAEGSSAAQPAKQRVQPTRRWRPGRHIYSPQGHRIRIK